MENIDCTVSMIFTRGRLSVFQNAMCKKFQKNDNRIVFNLKNTKYKNGIPKFMSKNISRCRISTFTMVTNSMFSVANEFKLIMLIQSVQFGKIITISDHLRTKFVKLI